MVIEPIPVPILPQNKSNHIILTVQSDLVRKDMRHETRLFFHGIKTDAGFNDLRDKWHGTGQRLIKSMRKRVFNPLGRHLYLPACIGIDNGRTL